jgi:hypothetical protein
VIRRPFLCPSFPHRYFTAGFAVVCRSIVSSVCNLVKSDYSQPLRRNARECCIVSALARAEAGGDRSYALRQSTITVYSRHHCRSSQP